MSEMDYNDLSILFDDEDISEKKDDKKSGGGRKWFVPVTIIAIFGAVVGGAVVFGQQDQPIEETEPVPTTEQVSDDLSVELVNLQQLSWAEQSCSAINKWSEDKKELKPTGNETNPNKARKFISWDIDRNLERLSEISQDFSSMPESSLTQAKNKEEETHPGQNHLKVGSEIDAEVSAASRGIASAFEGYSSALETLQSNLNGIADYNFNGIRDGISKTNDDLASLSTQLAETLSQNFNEESFDNLATIKAVSELDACNGIMIDAGKLRGEKSEELDMVEKIDRIVSVRRCQSYLDNTSENVEDETISAHRASCQDVVSSIVLDPNDPHADAQIDMKESQRVVPQGAQQGDGKDTDKKEPSKPTSSTSNPESRSSGSGEEEKSDSPAAPSIADQSSTDDGKKSSSTTTSTTNKDADKDTR